MDYKLPSGTVTFLFTDIEGSTKIAQEYPDSWEALQERHHTILRSSMKSHGGHIFQIIGDAFCVAFHNASEALDAAIDAQKRLLTENWGDASIKVRMGINTGLALAGSNVDGSGGYSGYLTLVLAQRVMSTAYGQQILISNNSFEQLQSNLPVGVTLRDMKEHRLKGLLNTEHIWQAVAPDLPQDFPALQTLNSIPNNLPFQLTSFIGRENEIAQVKQLLADHRLVTLTGSGGVGKTRHCLQVGAEMLEAFPDGVWLVELAPVTNPALVSQAVASVLGLRDDKGHPIMEVLQEHLKGKNALLLLDNCEHLVEASAQFAVTLLQACPQLRILATSREALCTAGENAFRVTSLSMPDLQHLPSLETLSQFDSVRLFTERAQTVKSDFTISGENAPAVAQVCTRLDGIPLAIELAAARVKGLSVEQISQRLDDRFRLLSSGNRTALPRHQTLRASIEWSYDLLPEAERSLLRGLTVFVGDWTLDAAEAVCAQPGQMTASPSATAAPQVGAPNMTSTVMELMLRLVDKSLIITEEKGGQLRYRMLETIRQFAYDKLVESGEEGRLRNRHLDYFLSFSEQAEPNLHGERQLIWLNHLGAEYVNLQAALEWARKAGSAQPASRLALATEQLADVKSLLGATTQSIPLYQEALQLWQSPGVEPSKVDKWTLVRLYRKIGETFHIIPYWQGGQFETIAQTNLDKALKLIEGEEPHLESVRVLTTLADDRFRIRPQQDLDAAERYANAAVAMSERLDATVELSAALGALDTVYGSRGLYLERVQLARRQLEISRDARFVDPRKRINLLCQAGNALLFVGEYDEALQHLFEAEKLADEIQDVNQQILALGLQAQCFAGLDRWEEMLQIETHRQALEEHYGHKIRMCFYCGLSANIYALRGEFDQSIAVREEVYTMMVPNRGAAQETWAPGTHY